MIYLVADIGGTNTRISLANRAGILHDTKVSFPNQDFADFPSVLRTYLANHKGTKIEMAAIALAGPVHNATVQLTNYSWCISAADVCAIIGVETTVLLNDLTALGYAAPLLPKDSTTPILTAPKGDENGQILVLGIGTGINLCAVKMSGDNILQAFSAEAGHGALPHPVAQTLLNAGARLGGYETIEDVLSGSGLEHLHADLTGQTASGESILAAAAKNDPEAVNTVSVFAACAGQFCRELTLLYLPRDGFYLGGSVARAVINSSAKTQFLDAFAQAKPSVQALEHFPVFLIQDDAAALVGCHHYLTQISPTPRS